MGEGRISIKCGVFGQVWARVGAKVPSPKLGLGIQWPGIVIDEWENFSLPYLTIYQYHLRARAREVEDSEITWRGRGREKEGDGVIGIELEGGQWLVWIVIGVEKLWKWNSSLVCVGGKRQTAAAQAARVALAGNFPPKPEMAGIASFCLKYKSCSEMTVSPFLKKPPSLNQNAQNTKKWWWFYY